MIETCPARSVEDIREGFIPEVAIPEACMRCIQTAIEDPASRKSVTDTYEKGLAYIRETGGDGVDPEGRDTWGETALTPPAIGLARQALIERGFDIYFYNGDGTASSQSYIEGTETEVIEVAFECHEEAAQ